MAAVETEVVAERLLKSVDLIADACFAPDAEKRQVFGDLGGVDVEGFGNAGGRDILNGRVT